MQKACLERYRQASMQIMLLLRSLVPQVAVHVPLAFELDRAGD